MQNKTCLTFSLILFFISIKSQHISYSGKIIESRDKEILVTLQHTKDSTVIYSLYTDKHFFKFDTISKGKYIRCLTNEYIHQCTNIELYRDTYEDISTDEEKTKKIDEIIVNRKKPFIINTNGTLTVHIENSPLLSSGSVFETLMKLPMIQYSHSSNTFKAKGKEGIQILIDGQRVYLSSTELTNYLKNISSSEVEAVEINTNPSAKYDASGNAAIINIKTKKIKKVGFYTGVSWANIQAKYYKQNMSVKSQYNTLNSRYMIQYVNALDNDFEDAKTYHSFENKHSAQDTYAKIKGKTNTLNAQFERKFKNSNLFLNSTMSFYKENINQNTLLNIVNKQLNSNILNIQSIQNSQNTLKNFNIGLHYTVNFNKSDLSFKSNYISHLINNHSILKSVLFPSTNSYYPDLKNDSPNKINAFVLQGDYEYKIDSLSRFEVGSKLIYQKIDNKNIFSQYSNNIWEYDYIKSNEYLYKELIFSIYSQYYKTINKFDFILGGRIEYTPSTGMNHKNNYTIQKSPVHFFPYLNIAYNHSENHNLNFSFTKRINRPTFDDLMPFEYYITPFTKMIGNPYLHPNISNNFDLQYLFKQKYVFSILYSYSKNGIHQIIQQNNLDTSTLLSPYNIERAETITLNSNLTFHPYKWWELNLNGILFYDKIRSSSPYISQNNFSSQIVMSNIFSLPNKFKFELSTDYLAPSIQGAYKTNTLFLVNAGVSKNFLNNKLKIAIIGNDIFKTYRIKNTSIVKGQLLSIHQNIGTHWIKLSVSYKFSKGIEKKSKTENHLDEIQSRIR